MERITDIPEMSQELPSEYLSKSGLPVNGVSVESFQRMFGSLSREYGINSAQIVEAASYSMAMVVRAALGLSAAGGRICALATDSLTGWIALATMRHLANGGADPVVVLITPPETQSADLDLQLKPLIKMNVPIYDWAPTGNEKDLSNLLESCHNCILGVTNLGSEPQHFETELSHVLTELATPVHCIQAPPGIHVDSGKPFPTAIFASSTLSLGIPLAGLYAGREYVGRHYVCDISIPRDQYKLAGQDLTMLFSDQPVVQLIPQDAKVTATQ